MEGSTMEEQHRVCPERWCGSGAWLVQRAMHLHDVRQVTHAENGGCWTMAATDPVCPRCGTTLVTILELDGGLVASDIVEPGKLPDWLLTL